MKRWFLLEQDRARLHPEKKQKPTVIQADDLELLAHDPRAVRKPDKIPDPVATETIFEEVYGAELWDRLVKGLDPKVAVVTQLRYKLELSAREIFTNPTIRVMGIEKKQIPDLLRVGEQALRERLPQLLQ